MIDSSNSDLILRAKDIIHGSHLGDEEKKMLEGRIPFISHTMLQMFVQVCEEDPFSIDGIVRSLKKKLDASGNLKQLHEIVKQERRELEDQLAVG